MKKIFIFTIILSLLILQTSCAHKSIHMSLVNEKELTKVKLILDFVPNTNHTGIYVAKEKGYYGQEGIDLDIVEPVDGVANTLVATGKGDFGISYQEDVTYARTGNEKLPIKAIATIVQHNTSGIVSVKSKGISIPHDFEGKTYAGWGSPAEAAVLKAIMKASGADPSKLKIVVADNLDYSALNKEIDLMWFFWAWDVIPAKEAGIDLNFISLQNYDNRLDYYTPVIVTNENIIQKNPNLARAFLKATQRGYEYAIKNPDEGAKIISKYVTSYDENVLKKSQEYLSDKYIDDSEHWGKMKREVWKGYMDFMKENDLIENMVEPEECFTNEFLPYNEQK
ncbi:MAG: ABC transporter substrate-binding protein [Eubacteriales bacterium]